MKKLNENVLRKLILETIDDQYLNEGKKKNKKKKLREADPTDGPVVNPEDSRDQDSPGGFQDMSPEEAEATAARLGLAGSNSQQIAQANTPNEIKSIEDVEASLNALKQLSSNPILKDTIEPSFKAFVKKLETYVFGKKQEE